MALSEKEQRLTRLFVAVVLGDWSSLLEVRAQAAPDEPDRAWREAVLQAHLFAGFPRVVEACTRLAKVGGLGQPEPEELEAPAPEPERLQAGEAVFAQIYAGQGPTVDAKLTEYHPDLRSWILGHAYGRTLSRAGLSLRLRELLAVAALAVTGQDRQMASHAKGAIRVGASLEEVVAAVDLVWRSMNETQRERARMVLERFAS